MQQTFDFLSDGSELGALMRTQDWMSTPLGSPLDWPDVLKTSLRLVLTSNHPMFIWWGADLTQFYNDAYRQTMGPERHPSALGQSGRECWAEIWDIIGPQIESIMAGGKATWHEDQCVPVTRHGRREDVWWTYGYSPIQDGAGVRGVLVVCNDVTLEHQSREKLRGLNQQLVEEVQRREEAERHLAFQLALSDRLRGLSNAKDIAMTAFAMLGPHLSVSRINYVEINTSNDTFCISHEWKQDDLSSLTGFEGALGDLGPEILTSLRRKDIVRVNDIVADFRTASHIEAYAAIDARAVLIVPLIKDGNFVASMSLQRSVPYDWPSSQITLVEDISRRIWNAIEHARAETERSKAAEALVLERGAEAERLRSLFQQAPGFMAIVQGPKHVFEFCNSAYLRLVGQRHLLGESVRDALPEVEGQGFFELLDQVFATATPFSAIDVPLSIQRQPGAASTQTYVDFVYQPIINIDGTVTGIFVEGSDSTERKLSKLALEASEERLKEGMAAARMVIWDWNLVTDQVIFSENAPMVLGGDWTTGVGAFQPMHGEDLPRLQTAIEAAIATGSSYEEVVRATRPDNSKPMWLQVHGKVLCDENGKAIAVRGVSIDVTERKQAEEALRDADQRKDEFLAMLAHELRNPLAPIGSAAQILSIAGHDEQRVRRTSEIIRRQVDHMTSLINDMLDVSRVTSGLITLDKHKLDVKQIVAESVEQVWPSIERRRHRFSLLSCPDFTTVVGDRKRLVQVIANLLQNAAKYTPDAGIISLEVKRCNAEILITVSDNGIGMDADLLPHVFELFTQGKRSSDRSQGGLGLGLALVKSLVLLHGGRVTAASGGKGKGASFTVAVPRFSGSPEDLSSPDWKMETAPDVTSLRVMVVDDNVDAALAMAMVLEAAGHDAMIEHTPEAALERAHNETPDVVLLDIGLPGMDGNEVARRLRLITNTANATLIAVTGYGQDQDRQISILAGFDHYFVKPANLEKLVSLLASIKPTSR
jgi:signal transduction histidine kinase/CheY-like chemotaxis protein